jgi:hypothetical protein
LRIEELWKKCGREAAIAMARSLCYRVKMAQDKNKGINSRWVLSDDIGVLAITGTDWAIHREGKGKRRTRAKVKLYHRTACFQGRNDGMG